MADSTADARREDEVPPLTKGVLGKDVKAPFREGTRELDVGIPKAEVDVVTDKSTNAAATASFIVKGLGGSM